MSRKIIFAIILVGLGVIASIIIASAYGLSGGNTAITLGMLFASVACIITGTILAFSRLLDGTVNPLVAELHKDIEDDLKDLKERRVTSTHWMVILTGLALVVFSFFVLRFHKVEAAWGGVPVIFPTFIGMVALAWFIPRTKWFRFSPDRTPMWIFFVPTIGFIISLWLGLAQSEDMSLLGATRAAPVSYNTIQPGMLLFEGASDAANLGFTASLPNCDGDACGAILLVVGLIVLTLVLVVGSAFIPHFWILSGSILLGIMVLIAIHDLRLRPHQEPNTAQP